MNSVNRMILETEKYLNTYCSNSIYVCNENAQGILWNGKELFFIKKVNSKDTVFHKELLEQCHEAIKQDISNLLPKIIMKHMSKSI